MRTYTYTASDPAGEDRRGEVKAAHLTGALAELASMNLSNVRIERKRRFLERGSKRVKPVEVVHFTRQLAAFVSSGISIVKAIEGIQGETQSDAFSSVLGDIVLAIRKGERFADAFAVHPEVFSTAYVAALRSAETGGRLSETLEDLAVSLERELDTTRKIKKGLTYPLIVFVAAIAAVGVLALFTLPKFSEFFSSMGATLPWTARLLLALSGFVLSFWWLLAALGVGLFVALLQFFRSPRFRPRRDRFLLRVPAVGPVVHAISIERFCIVLASLLRAGVPLYDGLNIAGAATGNLIYRDALAAAGEGLLRGEGVAGPIARTQLFPANLCQMIRAGEDSGTLNSQLEHAARFYQKEAGYKIDRLTSLFEPVIVVMMAAVVGFVAIALVSTMYGMFGQIEGF